MREVEDFISELPKDEQVILKGLRALIFQAEPRIEEKLAYGFPYYSRHRRVCFLWPASGISCAVGVMPSPAAPKVTLGFWYGNLLSNDQGLLASEGRKQVYTIKISSLAEVYEPTLLEILNKAILVDKLLAKKKAKSKSYNLKEYGNTAQVYV